MPRPPLAPSLILATPPGPLSPPLIGGAVDGIIVVLSQTIGVRLILPARPRPRPLVVGAAPDEIIVVIGCPDVPAAEETSELVCCTSEESAAAARNN